jgi:hypothetical protein
MMTKKQPIDTKARILSDVELWSSIWWLRLSIAASTVRRSFMAKALGLSRPRISQLLSTEGDIQMSTVIKIALSTGYVPHLVLEPVDDYVKRKSIGGNLTLDHNGAIVDTRTRGDQS